MATKSNKRKVDKSGKPKDMTCEFRSGPVAGTAFVQGVTFGRKGLQYAIVDGLAMFEGDIILGTAGDVQAEADAGAGNLPQFSVGITGQQFRWPNATIPYDIDPALPNQQRITDAIAHWQANTRIRFVLRTAANAAQFTDFVHFQPGGGCSSMVGRRGGQQNITLAAGCGLGNTIHEIGHAVGLWHEQSREDRDTFVRIVWANIDPAMQHNFAQHIADGDDLGAYDYGSMMHYPATAFSTNGQATIVPLQPLPPGVVMGQRTGLSHGDINGVHLMYPPSRPTIKEAAKDPIRDTFKEIRKDPIRDTIKEIRKDPIRDTFKEIRKDPIKEIRKEFRHETLIERTSLPGLPFRDAPNYGASPYVLASPSRFNETSPDLYNEYSSQVEEIAEAITLLEQQQAELLTAYDEAVQILDALQKEGGQQ